MVLMDYELILVCGCLIRVHRWDGSDESPAATRWPVLERRGRCCTRPGHYAGARIFLWQLLPDHASRRPMRVTSDAIEWF